jgi:hypothetical protein
MMRFNHAIFFMITDGDTLWTDPKQFTAFEGHMATWEAPVDSFMVLTRQ